MEKKLHLLDSFMTQGSDGASYKVFGYEHLARDPSLTDGLEHWEPTGQSEYKLADGRRVEVRADGSMRIAGSDVSLMRPVPETI
jgi:hypothetical protein